MDWLNYQHLRYFWVVAREGSVSAAARKLYLARSTVTGQLRELEKAVGGVLFDRKGRTLVLTEFGRQIFQFADEIFATGRELEAFVSGSLKPPTPRFVVGAQDVVPKLIAFRLLQPALRMEPRVQIVCLEGKLEDLLADLALHRLDLVLSDSPASPTIDVKAFNHKLGESSTSIMASHNMAARYARGFPESLAAAPMLLPSEKTSCRSALDQWFDDHDIRPEIIAEFEDTALMKVFGHEGEGLFPVPTVIEDDVKLQYDVSVVGRLPEVKELYYAISVEKRVKHRAVSEILRIGKDMIFR